MHGMGENGSGAVLDRAHPRLSRTTPSPRRTARTITRKEIHDRS
ncbi:hypothetical protein JCM18882A_17740 [Brevibacterium metallidurans]|uniref:Uncharacterized protein n=1 Tax=Brevibacterium metallidurans TaxID=1482676 RepID=A0ABP3C680_9MICO